jgi:cytochrome c5
MKTKLALLSLSALVIYSCHTSKKSTTSTTSSANTNTTVATSTIATTPSVAVVRTRKAADGVYEPGEEEVAAIKPQYNDATLQQLKEGYTLYAISACKSCHGAANIYAYREDKWLFILQDMAYKAKLTAPQKEAVTRYVFAIKAADPQK